MEVSAQLHAPVTSTGGKITWYPLDRRMGGPQIRSRHCGREKNHALPGIQPGPSSPSPYRLSYPDSLFLIGIVGGGVQLGPLGTAATNRPIVPAPGDYDDGEIGGMMIGRGNRSTRSKPVPVLVCPTQIPHAARTGTRAAAVGSEQLTA
jgi:hypothetical protein